MLMKPQVITATTGVRTPVVHGFTEQLSWSESSGDEDFWGEIYRTAFPNFVNCMQTKGDTAAQRLGIDRVIALSNGDNIRIDEKKRRKEWGDILLEHVSVSTTNAPGWIEKDLQIDYIAYAFMENRKAYLLPWLLLRRAWLCNKEGWLAAAQRNEKGFCIVSAKNRSYETLSVAVPTNTLFRALNRAALVGLED